MKNIEAVWFNIKLVLYVSVFVNKKRLIVVSSTISLYETWYMNESYDVFGIPTQCIKVHALRQKVISHTFKSRQQDIKDALLVGWFALMSVLTICVPNQQFADPPTNVLIWNEIGYR